MPTAQSLRVWVYLLNFVFSIQFGLVLYFNSSFLTSLGFSENIIGIVFACAFALAALFHLALPPLLRALGNYKVFLYGTTATAILFLGLALTQDPYLRTLMLGIAIALSIPLYASLDIFLQTLSHDPDKVGVRRGTVTTVLHIAFLISQFLALFLLGQGNFTLLYGVSSLALFLLALLGAILMRDFHDVTYERTDLQTVFTTLRASPDLRNICIVQFLLRIFYSVMVVYTPVYLHIQLGFTFESMSIIFAVMLLPFIALEIVLGYFEDTRFGEQEVLAIGAVLIAITTMALSFITSTSIAVWALALLATRIGAAMLDSGTETYFFKKVTGEDSGEVSMFRMLYPIAHIVGPLLGVLFLLLFPIQYIFLALGTLLLFTLGPISKLHDTK